MPSPQPHIFSSASWIIIIAVIIISATVLSIISYSYSTSSADLIRKNAIDAINSNTQISAHDIAEMIKNKVKDIQSNIQIISNAPLVQEGQVDLVHVLYHGTGRNP